ncbi:MAG: DUF3800 domain-containing protein, partial [Methylovirgula sp.]
MPPIGYIAYIDESGDDGLGNPGDSRGASEWLVMSAVVIRESNEPDALQWLKTIIEKLKQPQ